MTNDFVTKLSVMSSTVTDQAAPGLLLQKGISNVTVTLISCFSFKGRKNKQRRAVSYIQIFK